MQVLLTDRTSNPKSLDAINIRINVSVWLLASTFMTTPPLSGQTATFLTLPKLELTSRVESSWAWIDIVLAGDWE
jgi:hypothetical protein